MPRMNPELCPSAAGFSFPTTGQSVADNALLLAIDDVSLPLRRNLCLYLSKPEVRAEPVLVPSPQPAAPDALAAHFYGTVLHDEGRFRMWYYPCSATSEIPDGASLQWLDKNLTQGPMCYAESSDGIDWVKPKLGQVSIRGSADNNAIQLSELPLEGVTLLKDDADPDPARRYKLVYNYWCRKQFFTLRTATSADGLRWSVGPEQPVDSFAEQASFYKHNGMYIANVQSGSPFTRSEGGGERGRQALAWISPDFEHWLQEPAESLLLPEPARPEERGIPKPYDQVHLGVGAASFGNVAVGLYCLWHNEPQPDDWFGMGTNSGDLVLCVSNDGIAFREPVQRHIYLSGVDSPVTAAPGAEYTTILCQANGILNVGDETRIYHGRWRNPREALHYYAEVALATLPRDRWGALGLFPDQNEGSVWSAPIALPDADCSVNLNAAGAAGMRLEIADARFNLMPELSGDNSGTCRQASGLDCPVHWPSTGLSQLRGRTIRLRLHLARRQQAAEPRLYAISLRRAG